VPGGFDSRFRVAAIERFQNLTFPQGAYPLVEWTVGREFRYATPYVQLTNLTDTKYQEIAGVAMPGRGVIAGVELRWKAK
jgi:iron complex outermembrane receptor protein